MTEKFDENRPNHLVSLTQKFSSYPDRATVIPGTTWQSLDTDNYHPPYYVSEVVLENHTWADPEDINQVKRNILKSYEGPISVDQKGRPLNPRGPTGIEGRGILGGWGANFAADPIVTRINPDGFLELIVIKRKDCGKWALPGGMVDKGERVTKTLSRELGEETAANLDFETAEPVYQGYVDDPRNTDNAWMETDAYHLHLDDNEAKSVNLQAGDDASDTRWMVCDIDQIDSLYASHSHSVRQAINLWANKNNLYVQNDGRVIKK